MPAITVSRHLGHESIKVTTDTYGHLLDYSADAASAAIERAFGTEVSSR